MFLFMPLHGVQVVTGKATEGTYKGFSCMGLPDMGITTISRPLYGVTLRAGPLSNTPHHDNNRLLWKLFFFLFYWWSRGGILVFSPTSMDNAGGGGVISIGVVLPFSWHRRLGRSPGHASSTASLNSSHPSATVVCPCATILWPTATFLTATNKKVVLFNMFNTYMHFILEILVLIFYGIWHVQHRVQYSTVPVKIFFFVSCPFLKILSTSWSSLVLSSSSSSELLMIINAPNLLTYLIPGFGVLPLDIINLQC